MKQQKTHPPHMWLQHVTTTTTTTTTATATTTATTTTATATATTTTATATTTTCKPPCFILETLPDVPKLHLNSKGRILCCKSCVARLQGACFLFHSKEVIKLNTSKKTNNLWIYPDLPTATKKRSAGFLHAMFPTNEVAFCLGKHSQ